jgi:hypothetical protein
MSLFMILALVALTAALLPALLYLRNRREFVPPPAAGTGTPAVSLLIPARNEAQSIGPALDAALASTGVTLEIIVLDDQSTDATADIVRGYGARVRLEAAPPLPAGWCGKQHACHILAGHATHDVLVFVDADVRLAPEALARMVQFLHTSGAGLVSGFPHQETGTLLERLVLPLIHFLLLGFLPLHLMRQSKLPAFAAGCGQLFVTTKAAYVQAGGHAAIRTSLHDGLTLPRAYRSAGLTTDLCAATSLAECRMYRSAGELWHGLAKNAREGLAAPRLIVFSTALLLAGQVLPISLLIAGAFVEASALELSVAGVATALAYAPRLDAAARYRQSWLGAGLHPLGVLVLLAIQWYATLRALVGRPVGWKGRAHPTTQQA